MIKRQRDFPKELIVKDATYSIRFARNIPGEPSDTVGLCDDGEKIIWIRQGQTANDRYLTFVHELAHAITEEWKLPDVSHKLIYAIETPIMRLLLDNL